MKHKIFVWLFIVHLHLSRTIVCKLTVLVIWFFFICCCSVVVHFFYAIRNTLSTCQCLSHNNIHTFLYMYVQCQINLNISFMWDVKINFLRIRRFCTERYARMAIMSNSVPNKLCGYTMRHRFLLIAASARVCVS